MKDIVEAISRMEPRSQELVGSGLSELLSSSSEVLSIDGEPYITVVGSEIGQSSRARFWLGEGFSGAEETAEGLVNWLLGISHRFFRFCLEEEGELILAVSKVLPKGTSSVDVGAWLRKNKAAGPALALQAPEVKRIVDQLSKDPSSYKGPVFYVGHFRQFWKNLNSYCSNIKKSAQASPSGYGGYFAFARSALFLTKGVLNKMNLSPASHEALSFGGFSEDAALLGSEISCLLKEPLAPRSYFPPGPVDYPRSEEKVEHLKPHPLPEILLEGAVKAPVALKPAKIHAKVGARSLKLVLRFVSLAEGLVFGMFYVFRIPLVLIRYAVFNIVKCFSSLTALIMS